MNHVVHDNILKLIINYIQVFQHFQKLNFCVCHQTLIKLVNILGSDYDAEVHQWKELLCVGQQDYNVNNHILAWSLLKLPSVHQLHQIQYYRQ